MVGFGKIVGDFRMISYDPLWKKLIDLKMSKSELAKVTGLSRTTISKMAAGESVTLDVINRICTKLEVPINDVAEILPDCYEVTFVK